MSTTLWFNCRLATLESGDDRLIEDGAIVTEGEKIIWLGKCAAAPLTSKKIDLAGALVTPGLIDCHTHAIFGGERSLEFEARLNGASYSDIAKAGGGILNTVLKTRAASEELLFTTAKKRLEALILDGVTTVEIKSGYGLDLETERKMLKVARRLNEALPLTIVTSCLAAHTIPPEYQGKRDEYIKYLCDEVLPTLDAEGLIDAVDVFCESIAFSLAETETIFKKAQGLNLSVKIHAEQLTALGGSTLAASFKALSADHLEFMQEEDAKALAAAGTVAVLLPGAFHTLREKECPPIDLLRKHKVAIAIASDLNPGTSPCLSLRLMMNFACIYFGLTPQEAMAAVTRNAAQALGLSASHGTLSVGKYADFVAWEVDSIAELSYWLGGTLPHQMIWHGQLQAQGAGL